MSARSDWIEQHPLWAALDSASGVVGSLDVPSDPANRELIDELQRFLAAARALKKSIDPALAADSALNQANAQLTAVANSINNFASKPGHPPYLAQAVAQLDPVRLHLNSLPRTLGNPAARAAVTRALRDYQDDLEASRAALSGRLDEVIGASEAREVAVVQQMSDINRQLAALETRIGNDESRLSDALTATNETFNSAQTARVNDFRKWLIAQETSFGKLAEPHLESLQASAAAAEANLAEIAALRDSTVGMAHLASGDILAGQFKSHARSERLSAYIAYGIGLVASVSAILVLLFAFGRVTESLPWQAVALKLSITAILGGVVTVAFRYAGKAIGRSTSFKRQELELRALGPFLAEVSGAEAAKVEFVKRAFGRAWDPGTSTPEPDQLENLVKFVAVVRDLAKPGNGATPT